MNQRLEKKDSGYMRLDIILQQATYKIPLMKIILVLGKQQCYCSEPMDSLTCQC